MNPINTIKVQGSGSLTINQIQATSNDEFKVIELNNTLTFIFREDTLNNNTYNFSSFNNTNFNFNNSNSSNTSTCFVGDASISCRDNNIHINTNKKDTIVWVNNVKYVPFVDSSSEIKEQTKPIEQEWVKQYYFKYDKYTLLIHTMMLCKATRVKCSNIPNTMISNAFEIQVSGASQLTFDSKTKYTFEKLKLHCSGSSNLNCGNMETNYLTAFVSGSSNIDKVYCYNQVQVTCSGSSHMAFYCKENTGVQSNTSGHSFITKNIF